MTHASLVGALRQLCGADAVADDIRSRELVAHDISSHAASLPAAVVAPSTVAALAQAVARITAHGLAVAPRGGGMSYTQGYVPQDAARAWVCLDLTRLNRVVELNAADMYLTVEAGCTWAQVREVLSGTGLTTPYGGVLSQNSMFFGAGQHGAAAESVLGLDVVLASGEVLTTGSAAMRASSAFTRIGGPDLTGLFVGDTGALGIKATATLRLIRAPRSQGFAS